MNAEYWSLGASVLVINRIDPLKEDTFLLLFPFAMAGIPLDKAELLALFLETLIYGVCPSLGRSGKSLIKG